MQDTKNQIPANDNSGKAVTVTPTGGALTSLTALSTALSHVLAVSGSRPGTSDMMFFKSRDDGGIWIWGPKGTVVEEDSQWACNPETFMWGYIAFPDGKTVSLTESYFVN